MLKIRTPTGEDADVRTRYATPWHIAEKRVSVDHGSVNKMSDSKCPHVVVYTCTYYTWLYVYLFTHTHTHTQNDSVKGCISSAGFAATTTARVKVYETGGGCARYLIRTGNWICSRSESPRSEDIPNSPRDPCARVLNVILERYRLEVAADRVNIHIYVPATEEGRVREKRAVVCYTLRVLCIELYCITCNRSRANRAWRFALYANPFLFLGQWILMTNPLYYERV